MGRVSVNNLKEGMVLEEDLSAPNGRFILGKGAVLKEGIVQEPDVREQILDLDREAGKAGGIGGEESPKVTGSDRAAMILHGLPCGGSNRRHGFDSETHANRSTDLCMTPIH